MKVAVVVTEIGAGVGGRFTFQETLAQTIRDLEQDTPHEFNFYARGISRYTTGSIRWLARRAAQVSATRTVQASRDLQDRLLGKRLLHLRTSLDRQLDADGAQLVWFPTTYAEDCELPFICTVFDLEHIRQPWFPEVSQGGEWERRQWSFNRYLPKATRVIVPNQAVSGQLQDYYGVGPERVLTLPHPTPEFARRAATGPRQSPELLQRLGIGQPYLLYPAQYWPHKNHVTLLRALRQLRDAGEEYELVCVGSDQGIREHLDELERQLGLTRFVHHLGFVTEDELVALYQHAFALVYPSLFGPENLPPLEAFALGCPVIGTDIEGAREQLGDAALLVAPLDPQATADAVQELVDEELRETLVSAGHRRAEERSPGHYVQGVLEFLDEFETIARCWS